MMANSKLQTGEKNYCGPAQRAAGSARADLIASLLAFWITFGLFLDGYSHHNLPHPPTTFFNIWHAILYSGFAALAGFLIYQQIRNMRQGYTWAQAIPPGYSLALIGIPIFGLTGIADMTWHQILGFEVGIENLFSPTHLMLAVSGVLLLSGPLLGTWRYSDAATEPHWKTHFAATLSMLMILSVLTFFTEYANSFSTPGTVAGAPIPVGEGQTLLEFYTYVHGIMGVFFPLILTMGIILLGIRQHTLPFGSMTLLIGGNNLLMAVFHLKEMSEYPQVLVAMLAAGVMADFLFWLLKPSAERMWTLRIFAFVTPLTLTLSYLLILMVTTGIGWSLPIWTGVVFLSGMIGLLLSCIVFPAAEFD